MQGLDQNIWHFGIFFKHFSGKLLPSINKDHLKMFFFSPSYAYCSVLKKINCITILVKGPLRGQEQEVEVNTKMNRQTNSASTWKPKSELRKWFTCILSRPLNFCSLVKGETATAVKFANWSEFQHVSHYRW